MKNLFVAFALVITTVPAFAEVQLPWTNSSNSVQAILHTALYELQQANQAIPNYQGYVKSNEAGELVVQDESAKIACDSKSFGMTAVQSYKCTLSSADLPWTTSSASVQAVLWDAMYEMKMADQEARFPREYVKQGKNGGELVVEFGRTKLVCTSRSLGMLAVQSYKCQLTLPMTIQGK